MLGAPDAAQAGLRISFKHLGLSSPVIISERPRENANVGGGQIEPLGAGRRHDVRGVSGKKHPPVLHRFDDEAPHRRDAFLNDRPLFQREVAAGVQPRLQLPPDAVIGPVGDLFARVALDIESRDLWRAHAEESEAAFVMAVDKLFRRWFGFGQNAEPAERICALVDGQRAFGNRLAADAVRSVAARDEVAGDLPLFALPPKANLRRLAVEVAHAHVLDFEEYLGAGVEPGADQILNDLGLAVDRDGAPAGQLMHIDAMATPAKTQLDAVVDESLSTHPLADASFVEDVHSALLQHARPDAALDILAAAGFDHYGFDALQPQQTTEQQSRRPCPYDADLCSHGLLLNIVGSGQWIVGSG